MTDYCDECSAYGWCDRCGTTCKHWPCSCDAKEEPQERHEQMIKRAVQLDKQSSDGGPASYYDFPENNWVTLNDMLEWLAVHRWGEYSLHLKDDMKASFRLGVKDGTELGYDLRKKIYSSLRLLLMAEGKGSVREVLRKLADDPQFK